MKKYDENILIYALHTECDKTGTRVRVIDEISIHALHTECDKGQTSVSG